MSDTVRVFRRDEPSGTGTQQTPGMRREEIMSTARAWAGTVRMAPGAVSGWHHHGDYETYIHMVSGRARLEFGPGGRESAEAGPGDMLYVPKGIVHREANSNPGENFAFLVRVGSGPPVFNVDAPDG